MRSTGQVAACALLHSPSRRRRLPHRLPAPTPLSCVQLGHGHFHDEGLLQLVETIRHERIVSVAAGRAHSVALAADGKIFSWGDASRGQLGHAQLAAMMQGPNPAPLSIPFPQAIQSLEPARLKPPARVTAIAAGGDHSMAVTVAGTLLAFGCNKHGQVGSLARAGGCLHAALELCSRRSVRMLSPT